MVANVTFNTQLSCGCKKIEKKKMSAVMQIMFDIWVITFFLVSKPDVNGKFYPEMIYCSVGTKVHACNALTGRIQDV